MFKSLGLAMVLAAAGFACTIFPTPVRYDTVSPGVVVVTEASTSDSSQRDTVLISRHSEMKAHFEAGFNDSALVFIGQVDSGFYVPGDQDTFGITADLLLASSPEDSSFGSRLYLRLSIDTLFRGSLPGKTFWVRAEAVPSLCGISHALFQYRGAFLNASEGLTKLSDLKIGGGTEMAALVYTPGFPAAEFFNGRYLVSPRFPGLRLDITELFPTYPATGILSHKHPMGPRKSDGRVYRLDGRAVPAGAEPSLKRSVPLIRE